MKKYSTMEINRDWRIKVSGNFNGQKLNTLVGCSGLLALIGETLFWKFVNRAYDSWADKCPCRVYAKGCVTFYGK
jgi:hypothetical protein